MIGCRKWLGAVIFAWLSAGCVGTPRAAQPTLAQVLLVLPSIATGAQFVERFGAPFSHEPLKPLRALDRDLWKGMDASSPPDLLDSLPVGTEIRLYYFLYRNSPINPTRGSLKIMTDENDRLIGWAYTKSLIGYEAQAYLVTI